MEELSMVSWKRGAGWVKHYARCSDLKNEVYSGDPNLNKGLMQFGCVACIQRVKIG
jgi:hypothetical protein